jgi:hypothetical protein
VTSTSKRCQATTGRGQPCQAWSCNGSEYCFWHDPDRLQDRAAARRRGGQARHGRSVIASGDPVTIESLGDLVELVNRAINDVLLLENSIARARALGYLAGVAITALQQSEIERRLAALESVLNARSENGKCYVR